MVVPLVMMRLMMISMTTGQPCRARVLPTGWMMMVRVHIVMLVVVVLRLLLHRGCGRMRME